MSTVALYLDKLNTHMEKMILDMCPPDVTLKFLEPNIGEKGAFAEADAYIVTTYRCTAEVIDQAPNLKLIQRTGVGVDMVDVAHAKAKGIPISICKGFNASSVAELAILYMLALYRRLIPLDALSRKGEWHTWTYRHDSFELRDKVIGIVGGGTIGKEVMKRLKCFDVTQLLYSDVYRMSAEEEAALGCTYVTLPELLQASDIVSLHAPLLASTQGMIGKAELAMMKDSAMLIDTARSQLVDVDAMLEALKAGKLWGAAMDVFEPTDPPFGVDGLNLITTPHIGAATYDNYYRCYKLCMENLQRIAGGEAFEFTI